MESTPPHDTSDPREALPAPPPPLVVGVLGGIASGKSRVATLLAGPTGEVISADEIAHEVLDSAEVAHRIEARFGRGVFGPDGRVDRSRLGPLIFDPGTGAEARRALESWIHPAVRARILARLADARASGRTCVVLDVPLLLENDAEHGLARACHRLVFVEVAAETRDRRARERRGWAAGEVQRRENAQLPLAAKRALADFVIQNNGSLEDLKQAVAALHPRLALAREPRRP